MSNTQPIMPIIHRLSATPSTQLLAAQRAAVLMTEDRPPPLGYCEAWIAETQLRGRGQHHRPFASPPGGFYVSLLLTLSRPVGIEILPLAVGWQCARALTTLGCPGVAIRWPNDLCLDGRKLGGILCQSVINGDRCLAIIGVGMNTNSRLTDFPGELQPFITTLVEHGVAVDHEVLLQHFVTGMRELLDPDEVARCAVQVASLDAARGRQITAIADGVEVEGISHGWGEDGHLRLDTRDGTRELLSATITKIDGRKVRLED